MFGVSRVDAIVNESQRVQGTLNAESAPLHYGPFQALFPVGLRHQLQTSTFTPRLLMPNPIRIVRCVYMYICNRPLAL
jgi:hypothetical protein